MRTCPSTRVSPSQTVASFAVAVALLLGAEQPASASSHREAPFVTKNPKVDGTDLYMFRSYEVGRGEYLTLLASFQPLQRPEGGPSFYSMDPEALYEIHVDNDGDGVEDVTFQFRFANALADASGETGITLPIGPPGQAKNVSIPLILAGGIDQVNQFEPRRRNDLETYVPRIVRGPRRGANAADITKLRGLGGTTFVKPIDYVGEKSLGDRATYETYARAHIFDVDIPGCTAPSGTSPRIFVGQRIESFAARIGHLFDLVNVGVGELTDTASLIQSPLANTNVTTIAVEVPIACVRGAQDVLGAWSTASVRQARVIDPEPSFRKPTREGGMWAQVSRVGNPLVNELFVGMKDKDRFNSSEPKDDAQFLDYVTHPALPALLESLFGPTLAAPTAFPRADLVSAFFTGISGITRPGGTPATAEMLRLNVGLPHAAMTTQYRASASPFAAGLGAIGCFKPGPNPLTDPKTVDVALQLCDPAGYPNGRRPGDDVTDIVLRLAMGYLLPGGAAPAGGLPLGDGVGQYDMQFAVTARAKFPYLSTPAPGVIAN